jgi:hypothetical protein
LKLKLDEIPAIHRTIKVQDGENGTQAWEKGIQNKFDGTPESPDKNRR